MKRPQILPLYSYGASTRGTFINTKCELSVTGGYILAKSFGDGNGPLQIEFGY